MVRRWSLYYDHPPESNGIKYSLELKLALTLRYLGSLGSLAEIAGLFGVSVPTVFLESTSVYAASYTKTQSVCQISVYRG